jgi:polyisoprenoid-binding protein YceI
MADGGNNMKTRFSFLAAVWLAAAPLSAQYDVDPAHSQVLFKVRHLGISTVTGEFKDFTATFDVDPEDLSTLKAEATIDTASVDTREPDRDKHLKSADFFDVETHPQIRFVSTKAEPVSASEVKLHGNLTIRGVTKPVVLDAEFGGTVVDGRGNHRAAFTAETKINRKDFGVSWNRTLDAGGLVVGEEVTIQIELEAIRKKEATQ